MIPPEIQVYPSPSPAGSQHTDEDRLDLDIAINTLKAVRDEAKVCDPHSPAYVLNWRSVRVMQPFVPTPLDIANDKIADATVHLRKIAALGGESGKLAEFVLLTTFGVTV